jgi:hypothetical protein
MDKLTPTARLTLDTLEAGPGNVHELCGRTGRSRSATDKALSELAKANLIVKVDGGDPADGAPTRWQLADPPPVDGEATQPDTADDDSPTQPAADQPGTADAAEPDAAEAQAATTDVDTADPARPGGSMIPAADAEATDQASAPVSDSPPAAADSDPAPATDGQPDGEPKPDGDAEQTAEADQPKLCRGCQAQIPKICECCWQKTPAYCGKCRRNMPQAHRGEPGEPAILSNGLPKLRPGELEQLVEKVMREHPVPHHVGVTGWTGSRVAVYLPGRSTGAINNALEKLTRTGTAEPIGDRPMRYQLKGANTTHVDVNADTAHAQQPEAGQSAGDRAAEAATPEADTAA